MTTYPIDPSTTPGILTGMSRRGANADAGRSTRFVTQSHALSAPVASPRSVFIAATIALAIYLIGRRLSG